MPNPYFQFKQFTIMQDRCAMKVCTDACLFGAWTAAKVRHMENTLMVPLHHYRVLDIGTGTGLLPLMLAQQATATIDTIEIEEQAYRQACENIAGSPWNHCIRALQGDARHYPFGTKYRVILSNPPFFQDDLRSPDPAVNQARHHDSLTLPELIATISANLEANGSFFLMVPFARAGYAIALAREAGFFLFENLRVRQSPAHSFFRSLLHFGHPAQQHTMETELTIKEGKDYTAGCRALLQPYYLYL